MIIILLILTIFSVLPLFSPGFFPIHDNQQVARLAQLDQVLRNGVFPVRWVPDLGFGYGYALFNFYPPLVYYLGEVFHLLGFTFLDSIKIVWGIALVGSALAMYFLSKEFFGKIGGLVSAIFYLYAPYHALDAYVRGALAELFSFVWLPLILLFSSKRKILPAAIFLSLLMLTHNLVFLPFAGFFILWSLFLGKKVFLSSILSIIFSFIMTAFFWLPSLAEKQFTLVDQFLTTSMANYQIHFVCPDQLWNSLWGYGGSVAGCLDGMSFKLGKPHIIVTLITVFLATFFYFRRHLSRTTYYIILTTFILLAASVFMTTSYSKIIWDKIPPLWYLQFPWRFLEFAALFSSLLAGGLFLVIKKPWQKLVWAAVLIFGVIFLHGKYFFPQSNDYQAADAAFLSDEEVKLKVSQTSFEYMLKGTQIKSTPQGSYTLASISYPTQKYLIIGGDFFADRGEFDAGKFFLTGNSYAGARLQFQTANFPGWKVWVNGKEVIIDDNNEIKLITVSVPAGFHEIRAVFTNTAARTAGNIISLAAIVLLFAFVAIGRLRLMVQHGTRRN